MSVPKISFLGAAGEVTGSMYLIEHDGARIVVDCGMHQGADAPDRGEGELPFDPSSIDAVILTHAHIDHSGRLPLLVKRGYKGKIWATDPTIELAGVLLRDTARLSAEDAAWRTRKNQRRGLPAVVPMYGEADVEETLSRFSFARFDDRIELKPGVSVRFRDSGHIIGSSIVEIWLGGGGGDERKVVFSGDIGSPDNVIERPPTVIEDADCVVIESTYGDRVHRGLDATRDELRELLRGAIEAGGKILIPTFAVDRAQRVLYELKRLQREPGFPKMPPIWFDSPMGAKATEIYRRHLGMLSREMQEIERAGDDPFAPDGLRYTSGPDESRAINEVDRAIVLAGSGMCTGGRIIHHLKHSLWDPKTRVIFVGYQARGTLGRRIVDGEKLVRIAGEEISVGAKISTLGGFSAHGDREDLLGWAAHFPQSARFFVTHGEPRASSSLAEALRARGCSAVAPEAGSTYEITSSSELSRPSAGRARPAAASKTELLSMLADIESAAEAMREAVARGGLRPELRPLVESARLIMETARGLGAGDRR